MYLTGQYDLEWESSEVFLANASNERLTFSIRFHDSNGGIVSESTGLEIKPFGSVIIKMAEIAKLRRKSGLFIIDGSVGISGEYRYRADDGQLRAIVPLKEGLGIVAFATDGLI